MNKNLLVLLGFGGHARSSADVALSCAYNELIFIDQNAHQDEFFFKFPIQQSMPLNFHDCFCAAGDNALRQKQFTQAINNRWYIVSLISPYATCGVGSEIKMGTLVAHHAHVGPMTLIGEGCIINTAAIVEHDCEVGNFSHISVNATIAGRVKIGENVFIGAGSTVRDGVTIADNIIIGAGATVTHDLNEPGVYIGTPAKLMLNKG